MCLWIQQTRGVAVVLAWLHIGLKVFEQEQV